MKKKIIAALLAATMVVGLLTGCGSSTTSAPAETKTEDAAPAEEAAAPVEEAAPAEEAPAAE